MSLHHQPFLRALQGLAKEHPELLLGVASEAKAANGAWHARLQLRPLHEDERAEVRLTVTERAARFELAEPVDFPLDPHLGLSVASGSGLYASAYTYLALDTKPAQVRHVLQAPLPPEGPTFFAQSELLRRLVVGLWRRREGFHATYARCHPRWPASAKSKIAARLAAARAQVLGDLKEEEEAAAPSAIEPAAVQELLQSVAPSPAWSVQPLDGDPPIAKLRLAGAPDEPGWRLLVHGIDTPGVLRLVLIQPCEPRWFFHQDLALRLSGNATCAPAGQFHMLNEDTILLMAELPFHPECAVPHVESVESVLQEIARATYAVDLQCLPYRQADAPLTHAEKEEIVRARAAHYDGLLKQEA